MNTLSPTEYLDSLAIEYTLIPHTPTFTAQHTAQASHIRGQELSKVIIVGEHGQNMMVVIPANCILVKKELTRLLRAPELKVVPEYEFRDQFPECEVGAMPPFGKNYGMRVLIAKELAEKEFITFNGGTHSLLIQMKTRDYMAISDAHSISVGYRAAGLSNPIISKRKDQWLWI